VTAPGSAADVRDPDASPVGERLSYVGGLDGIRAFAVAAVIAYHTGVTHITGGFLGVDVFFCLSGFLITSLLLGEARHTATIRLGQFWARRARRLLPALFLVLSFAGLLSWLAVAQGTYPGLRLDSLSTLLYVANWHFILEGSSYFKAALPPSPLTHTWSLAIEEQFYVVWPLVVLALVKLRRAPVALLTISVLGAVASTVWMAHRFVPGADPTRLYYGTDTHAMTLLSGAALAAALALLARTRDPSTLRASGVAGVAVQAAGIAGAVVLGAMALTVNGETHWLYRGGFLLAGIATAAVILSAVTVPRGPLAGLLGLAPIRFVGRISYGLYLWHYPMFIWLDAERTGLFGLPLLVLRLAVTLAVATVSFYLVERPVRHGLVLRGASAALATAAAVATTVAVIIATSLAAAIPAAGAAPPQPPFHDPVRALLIGDSTMLTLGVALAPWAHLYDVAEEDAGTLGCGVTFSNAQIEFGTPIPTALPCSLNPGRTGPTIYAAWAHEVATFRPEVVAILAGRWEVHNLKVGFQTVNITQRAFQSTVAAGLMRAVEISRSGGARVVLVTQPCANSGERADGQPWPEDSASRLAIYNGIVRSVARRTGASVLDLYSMVCPGGRYQQTIDGVTVRQPDGVHFSIASGGFFAPRIFRVLIADGRAAEALRGRSSRR
jgi:peptidoglycan/LPS O-acetylase OafA/YrhL